MSNTNKDQIGAADALDSQPTEPYPLLRAAFTTAESGADGYFIKFKFPTLVAMQKAHIEWIAAQLTDSTLAAPMVADPAGVATVYEWRHRHAEHMPWGEWKLCDKDQYDLVVERTRQNLSLQSSTKLDEVRATLAATVKAVPSEALDAARYRFLRDGFNPLFITTGPDPDGCNDCPAIMGDIADSAIDRAIAAPLADKTDENICNCSQGQCCQKCDPI